MKKPITLATVLMLSLLCSCANTENTATQIHFDTAVTLTADCSDEILNAAFSLCENYDKTLSRTNKNSEISSLNGGNEKVSPDTLEIIKKGVYYSALTKGKFDITVADLVSLWSFKDEVVPSRDEISEALKNVDYESVKVITDSVDAGGKKIDLGGIAKGFVSDKLLDFFKQKGVKKGIINLGGNVTVFGDRFYNIGIKKPFSESDTLATVKLKNKSVSTSGIYERYFKSGGELYHHILDTKTGYPVKTDLLSASVIGATSADCDALSTICVIYGLRDAKKLIEGTAGFEAVFVDKNYKVILTKGLENKNGIIEFKN
ncbi:MAG: FAD:protein FMN transferase [Clostridia bacterium]|nr:FAD:protein FMN transferase [Clostridia bacterium]